MVLARRDFAVRAVFRLSEVLFALFDFLEFFNYFFSFEGSDVMSWKVFLFGEGGREIFVKAFKKGFGFK